MSNSGVATNEFSTRRRNPRIRVAAPFPCSYAVVGLKKWEAVNRDGLGVVCDLSVAGVRMLSEAELAPGDEIAISLRLPHQRGATFIERAMVRWVKDSLFGIEFALLSPSAATRLGKCISREMHASALPPGTTA
ncbi:MAG: PilZ domain-containing protein [Nitrospira sp.]|nr:PilZ domain-containing protein [Nitrospira sp.]